MLEFKKVSGNDVKYGTSLIGKLPIGISYNDLVSTFGEPTFLPEDSGDGKVNFEWVFHSKNGDEFTIYDWKTYDAEFTKLNYGLSDFNEWHVGGVGYAGNFIEFILEKVSEKVGSLV